MTHIERLPKVNQSLLRKLDKMTTEDVCDLIVAWLDESQLDSFVSMLKQRVLR